MKIDDPRHGTNAGFIAHESAGERACQPCMTGRLRARKAVALAHLRGERMTFSSAEAMSAIQHWLDMGLGISAVAVAAGYDNRRCGDLKRILERDSWVRRGTYHALATITEDDFAPTAKIGAALTRQRVYSLMAAGHLLQDMPISSAGRWRDRQRITVSTARAVRDFYRSNEAKIGATGLTMSRARNAGHVPPLAWDDPGTLAWIGAAPELFKRKDRRPSRRRPDELDPSVVERLLVGETLTSTRAEKQEAMRRWIANGGTERALCLTHGWKDGRYVSREGDAA